MIALIFIMIIQSIINLVLAFFIKERYAKTYKISSYIFSIAIPILLPVIHMLRIFKAMSFNEAPDSVAISFGPNTLSLWVATILAMIMVQLIFNSFVLKQILERKNSSSTSTHASSPQTNRY